MINTAFLLTATFRTLLIMIACCLAWNIAIAEPTAIQPSDTVASETEKSAYQKLLPLAEAGNPEAQTNLGLMRIQGEVVTRDLPKARAWLGRAAVQNHAPAQFYLGQLLLLDVFNASKADLDKQLGEGLGWLRRAAREQHIYAQQVYSRTILESQRDNPYGHSKVEAQQHLASCAQVHEPCTRYALEKLDADEQNDTCLNKEVCETKRSLLYTLANGGDANAHYRLSKFENEDSMFWLRRAARLGHPAASHELAELVLNNQATLQAEDPAVLALLNTASQHEILPAMHLLGSLLYEGTRFPVNKPLGEQWLSMAAERGHEPSRLLLNDIQNSSNTEPSGNFNRNPIPSTP